MKSLTFDYFDAWMSAYGRASAENNPQASVERFAPTAEYYESPFSEPLVGRDALFDYWNHGAHELNDERSSYELLAVRGNHGIARWQAQHNVIATGEHFSVDCIFLVEFDDSGQCTLFQEWWHRRVISSSLAED